MFVGVDGGYGWFVFGVDYCRVGMWVWFGVGGWVCVDLDFVCVGMGGGIGYERSGVVWFWFLCCVVDVLILCVFWWNVFVGGIGYVLVFLLRRCWGVGLGL